jgi:hypothetical protein
MAGALNLGSLHDECTRGKDAPDQGALFILDEFALPCPDMTKKDPGWSQ